MNKREEEKGGYLEIGSEHHSSVGDHCMIEEVVRYSQNGYYSKTKGCDGAGPDSNKNENKSIYEHIHNEEDKLKERHQGN